MMKLTKFNFFDQHAIKLAFGFIPKHITKLSQEEIHILQQKKLHENVMKMTEKKEDEYLDFMTNLLKRKS